ncbi:thioredoxin-like protein 4B [Caerostris darwini]|uniref:Thioredoxin-like protein 4B n=1 Tax=Caerostris darwini TaxID=1538125 RepID=A0AAV4RAY6_9ARAC|nr:thioredoxin-like protein 4B [Caerostris darwini]
MNFLRQLKAKDEIDDTIKSVKQRVLVLRFGKDDEIGCMQTDDIMLRTEELLSEMATIYTINIKDVPACSSYYDITHIPSTVFYFNEKQIKINSGMPDNTKVVGPFQTKQDFIDLVEVIYRGASRGKCVIKSPIDRRRMSYYDKLHKGY